MNSNIPRFILFLLSSLWFVFLYYKWFIFSEHCTAYKDAMYFLSLETGPYFIINLKHSLYVFAEAVIFVISASGLGIVLIKKFFSKEFNSLETCLFSFTLGLGVIAALIFLLSACGMLYIYPVFIIIWAGFLCFLYSSCEFIPDTALLKQAIIRINTLSATENMLLFLIIVQLTLNFSASFTPDLSETDTLNYYLAVPNWWIINHGIADMEHHIYYNLFSFYGCVYAAAMMFGSELTAKVVNMFVASVGTVLIPVYLCRKYFDKKTILPALAIICTTYQFSQLAYNTGSDSFNVLLSLSALSAMLLYRPGETGTLTLSALFAGFAMASKATSLMFIVPVMGIIIYNNRTNRILMFRELVVFITFASIPVIPWLVKNYILRGNPFFPFLTGIFGLPEQYDINLMEYFRKSSYIFSGERSAFFKTLRYIFFSSETPFNLYTSPFLPAAAGFLPFIYKKPENIKQAFLLWFAAAVLIIQLNTVSTARYYLPVFIIISVFFADYLHKATERYGIVNFILPLILGFTLVPSFYMFRKNYFYMIPFGIKTHQEFPGYISGYADAVNWINTNLSDDVKVLLDDFDGRSFYMQKKYYVTSFFDKNWYDILLTSSDTPEIIYRKLMTEGITHILFNREKYCYSAECRNYRKKQKNPYIMKNLDEFRDKYLVQVYKSTYSITDSSIIYEIRDKTKKTAHRQIYK